MDIAKRPSLALAMLAALVSQTGFSDCAAEQPAPPQEAQLIETLRSAAPAEKAIACKELAIYGSQAAVPELAKLLADEQLASWARIALEAIPDQAADAALVEATKSLQGRLLVGTINSIGVRRGEAAVEQLASLLGTDDADVASAAAVALGRIGNKTATKSLRQSLAGAVPGVRSAVAEGCILCAERLMADGKTTEAAEIYDEVRRADVPQQRVLEATRGAILARQTGGVPLLVEQLKSPEKRFFQLGLSVARELAGQDVAEAIAAELPRTSPERAALLLYALADRPHAELSPAILEAAASGDKRVRLAALDVVGRFGAAEHVPALLAISADADGDVAQAAKAALGGLPGEAVNDAIMDGLISAEGQRLAILLELVGLRRMDATPALLKALKNSDEDVRNAALAALGATIGPQDLNVLISRVLDAGDDGDAAGRALQAAAIRMADGEATARTLAEALPRASTASKVRLLQILGAMGGPAALESIDAAAKDGDAVLQDAATRVLGEWMSVDAAPVLMRLAKDPANEKYQVRALRGYIRLARQFDMDDEQRADMCRQALEAATRPDEQKLVLAVLERYPSLETLTVAVDALQTPALKEDAARVARLIARKLGRRRPDVQELLKQVGATP